jgi:hypothetical protein
MAPPKHHILPTVLIDFSTQNPFYFVAALPEEDPVPHPTPHPQDLLFHQSKAFFQHINKTELSLQELSDYCTHHNLTFRLHHLHRNRITSKLQRYDNSLVWFDNTASTWAGLRGNSGGYFWRNFPEDIRSSRKDRVLEMLYKIKE